MIRAVELLGERIYAMVLDLGAIFTLFLQVVTWIVRPPAEIRNIVKQMEEVGIRSMPVVLVTATFTGMVLALQSYSGFQRFGATSFVGSVVALSITRELGPVFAGLMVSGRVGASMAAELGTMKVTEQIDALETLAIVARETAQALARVARQSQFFSGSIARSFRFPDVSVTIDGQPGPLMRGGLGDA